MGVAVGIDLGTTNTVVAVMRDGQPVTLADEGGRKLIPSFVAFHPSGKVLVGESAKDRRVVDPGNTIYSVKRLIGRTFSSDEVQRAIKAMPFEIVEGEFLCEFVPECGGQIGHRREAGRVLRRRATQSLEFVGRQQQPRGGREGGRASS